MGGGGKQVAREPPGGFQGARARPPFLLTAEPPAPPAQLLLLFPLSLLALFPTSSSPLHVVAHLRRAHTRRKASVGSALGWR